MIMTRPRASCSITAVNVRLPGPLMTASYDPRHDTRAPAAIVRLRPRRPSGTQAMLPSGRGEPGSRPALRAPVRRRRRGRHPGRRHRRAPRRLAGADAAGVLPVLATGGAAGRGAAAADGAGDGHPTGGAAPIRATTRRPGLSSPQPHLLRQQWGRTSAARLHARAAADERDPGPVWRPLRYPTPSVSRLTRRSETSVSGRTLPVVTSRR
jgi:hypothetical protein